MDIHTLLAVAIGCLIGMLLMVVVLVGACRLIMQTYLSSVLFAYNQIAQRIEITVLHMEDMMTRSPSQPIIKSSSRTMWDRLAEEKQKSEEATKVNPNPPG